ncbi:tRNA-queuosine alpha-mannosyltransferase-like [Lineus longissimus]|uniref:tRNA-queuosine alpha-mannosyltransferase-like n=1 Tax=Lineus longissimus TaxID=88925 RepID=UPI00315D023A
MDAEEHEATESEVREMLELQISEVEMLASMFPNPGEFCPEEDGDAVLFIQKYLDGKLKYELLLHRIGFTIKFSEDVCKTDIELVCRFPHKYPADLPDIFTRTKLPNTQHKKFSEDLYSYVQELERGELCMFSIVQWIQENSEHYCDLMLAGETVEKVTSYEPESFTRMWIYSHHIYKRDMALNQPEILLIEPFYGGSHKQLMDLLTAEFQGSELVTMTAKKWHWRARTASLYLSQTIPRRESYRVLFASSVLNLAELVSLRPDLAKLKKVMYFHENQLVYPVRKQQDRDFQYGYNQILSCLVADVVIFNSKFNRDSFLENISKFFKLIPDYRAKNLKEMISPKCTVIYFPLKLPPKTSGQDLPSDEKIQSGDCDVLVEKMDCGDDVERSSKLLNTNATAIQGSDAASSQNDTREKVKLTEDGFSFQDIIVDSGCSGKENQSEILDHDDDDRLTGQLSDQKECADPRFEGVTLNVESVLSCNDGSPLHIVWPHRWEHDKGPGVFFETLYKLKEEELDFEVSVLGETYLEIPAIFTEAREKLSSHILHWGFVESKDDYYKVLRSADVVVSTANHEFFGVAMLESVYLGCYPLCPNRLVYREIFPGDHLYNTDQQLFKRLRNFCREPKMCRRAKVDVDVEKYSWGKLQPVFKELLSWETRI